MSKQKTEQRITQPRAIIRPRAVHAHDRPRPLARDEGRASRQEHAVRRPASQSQPPSASKRPAAILEAVQQPARRSSPRWQRPASNSWMKTATALGVALPRPPRPLSSGTRGQIAMELGMNGPAGPFERRPSKCPRKFSRKFRFGIRQQLIKRRAPRRGRGSGLKPRQITQQQPLDPSRKRDR
jgi:hypothetical protein